MSRKHFIWKLKNRELRLGERTLIAGVLNVTPDSFSDGGLYQDPDRAYARAIQLEEQGADIIDIGAESTAPGSPRISAAEEIRRLIPVLKRLKGELGIPISVDTYKAEVAELAIEHGAEIINDPSGFTWDPLIAKVVVQSDAGLILNHMRGTPETWGKLGPLPDVMLSVSKDLDASISRARRSGVDRLAIVVDPGLGFGKRKEQNAEIIARLGILAKLEYPILLGPSRKSFLAQGTPAETQFATAAAVTAAVLGGAHLVRVHDVAEMRAVLNVADEILNALPKSDGEEEEAPRRVRRPAPTPEVASIPPARIPRPKLKLLREVPDEAPAAAAAEPPVAPPPPPIPAPAPAMDKPPATRKFSPRPSGDRKFAPRGDRDRPSGDRKFTPRGDRPSGDRKFPPRDRPSGDRKFPPRGDRPEGDRPRTSRPSGDRPPFGGKPGGGRPGGGRPFGGKPGGGRPGGGRPSGGRPSGGRPSGGRPGGGRPSGPPRQGR